MTDIFEASQPVSKIYGCYIISRQDSEKPIFHFGEDGKAAVWMQNYAIIPREMFTENAYNEAYRRWKLRVPVEETL